jgi:hypothetical protein
MVRFMQADEADPMGQADVAKDGVLPTEFGGITAAIASNTSDPFKVAIEEWDFDGRRLRCI